MTFKVIRPIYPIAITVAALVASAVVASPASAATGAFANCTKLNAVYKHGVGRPGAHDKVRGHTKPVTNFTVNARLYKLNSRLDRDHDGVACEKR